MLKAGFKLSEARVLITNDDGIRAPGIQLLTDLISPYVKEVFVVAPENEQSGTSHTTTTKNLLRLKDYGNNTYSLTGTPPDCILFALSEIMRDTPPSIVFSGINSGQNIAEDVHYSGTVAACFEASLAGIPAIALSQENLQDIPTDFSPSQAILIDTINMLIADSWPDNCLMSVNIPHKPVDHLLPLMPARLGRRTIGVDFTKNYDPRGHAFYWSAWSPYVSADAEAAPDTDIDLLRKGHVTVTPIQVDPTHQEGLFHLRRRLS